ncbi:hypothetical protein, partial [Neoroseomonas oryzicola]|uniref:hypothetical protein n=1 Tax=Neoroseomonas oryzicola TaxID=535904 RepID=UPI001BA99D94
MTKPAAPPFAAYAPAASARRARRVLRRLRAGRSLAIFSAPAPLPAMAEPAETEREGLALPSASPAGGRAAPRAARH